MQTRKVGMVGLGLMGSALAASLLKSGFQVVGYDPVAEKSAALAARGGEIARSSREVAERSDVLLTSLPSDAALRDAVLGQDGIAAAARSGLILIETSTLTIEAKEEVRRALEHAGVDMLDAPLNGTPVHVAHKQVFVFASGKKDVYDACRPIFEGFSQKSYYLGAFGMGMKMKFINNLLVTIHKVAAAEALVLGMKAGMDPEMIHEVIREGAGTSRMFEVKGALMVTGAYAEPMMKLDLFLKDIKLISDFADALRCPTPLHAAAKQFFTAAGAKGFGKCDTASVCAVVEEMAGLKRKNRAKA
jgi:3-hydroxyisobutyrate dehydrogenase-like beta-hydroxyacid dehydrogenase